MEDKEILQSMGKKIKDLRLQKGLTQDELAKKMGYTSRSTINKIEKGLVDISQSKIIEFANILNTTPLYLLNWVENPNDNKNIISIQKETGEFITYYTSNKFTEEVINFINKYFDME